MKTRILLFAILGLGLTSITSCSNTADGLGRDIEKAGQTIQNTF